MEKELNGVTYSIEKLNAFEQLHIARRLAPMLASLAGAEDEGGALPAIADTLSKMSDDDVNYIVNNCLKACKRKQEGKGYAKVMVSGALMFADIDLTAMLALVQAVVEENLGSFFPTSQLPSATQK
jgi:hypothetical protein